MLPSLMMYEYMLFNISYYIGKHINLICILSENFTKYETTFIKKWFWNEENVLRINFSHLLPWLLNKNNVLILWKHLKKFVKITNTRIFVFLLKIKN
jgi:hypothetical protein